MSRPITGRVEVQFRELNVEVSYTIDGGEVDWQFDSNPVEVMQLLRTASLSDDEEERIAERCWEDQWI